MPGAAAGMRYKYRIYKQDGAALDHCDPYGFYMELRPHNASILWDLGAYHFADGPWMRRRTDGRAGPMNIYEMHAGSWKKRERDGREVEGEAGWYDYTELADRLIPYLLDAGYNYVCLLYTSLTPSVCGYTGASGVAAASAAVSTVGFTISRWANPPDTLPKNRYSCSGSNFLEIYGLLK